LDFTLSKIVERDFPGDMIEINHIKALRNRINLLIQVDNVRDGS
jgi:hypothetical protein